jgi:hypothetical protein
MDVVRNSAFSTLLSLASIAGVAGFCAPAVAAPCGHACLERIGSEYLAAYIKHDPSQAPISKSVRYSENNVLLSFPDGTWDTVSKDLGGTLIFSDPVTGGVGIYTATMQSDKTPGYLAVRLKVENGLITQIEQISATQRYTGGVFKDPTSLPEPLNYPDLARPLSPSERISRAKMIEVANGYFNTLEHNDGTLKTRFGPNCQRSENGEDSSAPSPPNSAFGSIAPEHRNCWWGFTQGFYSFNNRVRDRDFVVIDEEKGLVLARAYIDHKGVASQTHPGPDGVKRPSFGPREPHTWSLLETFKIEHGGELGPIRADFIQVPYYMPPVWPTVQPRPDKTPDIPDYRHVPPRN